MVTNDRNRVVVRGRKPEAPPASTWAVQCSCNFFSFTFQSVWSNCCLFILFWWWYWPSFTLLVAFFTIVCMTRGIHCFRPFLLQPSYYLCYLPLFEFMFYDHLITLRLCFLRIISSFRVQLWYQRGGCNIVEIPLLSGFVRWNFDLNGYKASSVLPKVSETMTVDIAWVGALFSGCCHPTN